MKKNTNQNDDTLTIVVTRYEESDELVIKCLKSLFQQEKAKVQVIFLDQKSSKEINGSLSKLKKINVLFIYKPIPPRSLSYARNFGLKHAKTRYIAFCDVDCILSSNWANEILNIFHKVNCGIVGSKIVPDWGGEIKWFHKSKFIQEFFSLLDISKSPCSTTKVIGAAFAVDKELLGDEGYFKENLGRQKGNLSGGEETDLCERVINLGYSVYFTPHSTAYHYIPKSRMSYKWLIRRSYYGGLSRSMRKGKISPNNKVRLESEFIPLIIILPSYLFGYFRGKLQM